MIILFLDIDGVLNSTQNPGSLSSGMYGIAPQIATKLHRITKTTGAQVVLSSSWREDEILVEAIGQHLELMDITPILRGKSRGEEIRQWLNIRPSELGISIEKYAILDDGIDFYPDQPLFQTSPETGLTDDIADAVIRYLEK